MAVGRSPEGRTVAGVGTTNAAATVTGAAGSFHEEDVGRTITGTGIPAGTTIASVQSDTGATMSANATATGSITATFGAALDTNYGFVGWCPETDTESEVYRVTGVHANAPTVLANSTSSMLLRRVRTAA